MFNKRIFSAVCASMLIVGAASARTWNVSIAKFKGDKKAAVSLTFDDGLAEHYTIVAPELEKRGMRGTFGVCGGLINEDTLIVRTDRMTWGQLADMARRGHEISNHGWQHRNHGRFPLDTICRDIQHNDTVIYERTGMMPRTFFYPNNTKRTVPMAIAEIGRVGTRTFQISMGSKRQQPWIENWIKNVIDTCGWAVTMTHGITYGYDAFKDAKRLTDMLDCLKSHESELWIGTLHDVMAYTRERTFVKLDIDEGKNSLTVRPTLPINHELFNLPLTMIVGGKKKISRATAKQDGKPLEVIIRNDGTIQLDFNPHGGEIHITKE